MSARTSARWILGVALAMSAFGLLVASALAQTPTATPTGTPTATPTATATAEATATQAPSPADTGNAGLAESADGPAIALMIGAVVVIAGTVLGSRALMQRRTR